jgi:lambda repressor-like predicted transcriptional regulator
MCSTDKTSIYKPFLTSDTTHGTPCTSQLWCASTANSIHKDKHLDTTTTHRLDADSMCHSHGHDSLTHNLPDDDLDDTPRTAPQHHLSRQRSSTSNTLPTTTTCCPANQRTLAPSLGMACSPSPPGRYVDRRSPALRRQQSPLRGKHSFRSSTLL